MFTHAARPSATSARAMRSAQAPSGLASLQSFHRTVDAFSGLSQRNFKRLDHFLGLIYKRIDRNLDDIGTKYILSWIAYNDEINNRESFWVRHKSQTNEFFKELTEHFISLFKSPLRYDVMQFSVSMHDERILSMLDNMNDALENKDYSDADFDNLVDDMLSNLETYLESSTPNEKLKIADEAVLEECAEILLSASVGTLVENYDRWKFAAAEQKWSYFTPESYLVGEVFT